MHAPLNLAFVIDAIEANDPLQEDVELGVACRVFGHLEQRLEDVYNDLLEIVHQTSCLVHIEQAWYLNEPSHVGGKEFVVNNPSCELVPLINVSTVNGDAPFYELILACLEIGDDFLGDFS